MLGWMRESEHEEKLEAVRATYNQRLERARNMLRREATPCECKHCGETTVLVYIPGWVNVHTRPHPYDDRLISSITKDNKPRLERLHLDTMEKGCGTVAECAEVDDD